MQRFLGRIRARQEPSDDQKRHCNFIAANNDAAFNTRLDAMRELER